MKFFTFYFIYRVYQVHWYSLCGRIYRALRNSVLLWTRETYIESFSSKRTAMYCTVAIWGLIPSKCMWVCLFQTRPKYPRRHRFSSLVDSNCLFLRRQLISTSLTHTNNVWKIWKFTFIPSLQIAHLELHDFSLDLYKLKVAINNIFHTV